MVVRVSPGFPGTFGLQTGAGISLKRAGDGAFEMDGKEAAPLIQRGILEEMPGPEERGAGPQPEKGTASGKGRKQKDPDPDGGDLASLGAAEIG